jgi:hypothetical protein
LGIESFTEEVEEAEETEEAEVIASVSSDSSVKDSIGVVIFEDLDSKVQDYVKRAINRTLPSKAGYRNSLIFQFCRWLKACPDFEKLNARELKPLVKMWYELALPNMGTKAFDDTWADFTYGWPRVKYPKGDGVLKIAVENAMNPQYQLTAEMLYEKVEIRLLVRICFELQELQKDEPFWLAESDGACILGVTKPTVGRWFSMLEADNVIKKVQAHTNILATRYKFIAT